MEICQNRQYGTTNPLQIHYPVFPTECSALSIIANWLHIVFWQSESRWKPPDDVYFRSIMCTTHKKPRKRSYNLISSFFGAHFTHPAHHPLRSTSQRWFGIWQTGVASEIWSGKLEDRGVRPFAWVCICIAHYRHGIKVVLQISPTFWLLTSSLAMSTFSDLEV